MYNLNWENHKFQSHKQNYCELQKQWFKYSRSPLQMLSSQISEILSSFASVADLVVISRNTTWLSESEAVAWRCFIKKVYLKTSQNLPENICLFFNKEISSNRYFMKYRLRCGCFPEVSEILKKTYLVNFFKRLLLNHKIFCSSLF